MSKQEMIREIQIRQALDWKKPMFLPFEGPQTSAFNSEAYELFYGGSAGSGKSGLIVGAAITQSHRGIIFRKQYPQLREIEEQMLKFSIGRAKYNSTAHILKINDGRTVELGSAEHEKDWTKYQGRPHDTICIDEACEFPYELYSKLIAWCRTTKQGQRCRIILTGNPPTTDEGRWVINRFAPWLDKKHPLYPTLPGEIRWVITVSGKGDEWVTGPGMYEREGENYEALSRTFIPGKLDDNPMLRDSGYRSRLMNLREPLRSQLLYGDFTAGISDDEWQLIPSHWIESAFERGRAFIGKDPGRMTAAGCDIAHGGNDQTVISRCYSGYFAPILAFPGSMTPTAQDSIGLMWKHLPHNDIPIAIDSIGYGSGTADIAREHWRNIHPINVAEGFKGWYGQMPLRNMKAVMWFAFMQALDPVTGEGIAIAEDRELYQELCAHRWKAMSTGAEIRSKDEVKASIGRSPDKADAIILAYWASRTKPSISGAWG